MNRLESLKDKIKGWAIGAGFLLVIIYSFYSVFIKTSNEVGFLGMDKVGRQVFIQSMDAYLDPNADVDSDFFDHNILERLVVQEPMRTVLKFDIRDEREFKATPESIDAFLAQPASQIIDMYKGKVTMQDEWEITPDELRKLMEEKKVETIEDLFAGFGFEKFAVYSRGQLIKSVDLPRTKNVLHAG